MGEDILTHNVIIWLPNSGGGNCFYKAINQFFNNKEMYHYFYRKKICKQILSKINTDKIKYIYIYAKF